MKFKLLISIALCSLFSQLIDAQLSSTHFIPPLHVRNNDLTNANVYLSTPNGTAANPVTVRVQSGNGTFISIVRIWNGQSETVAIDLTTPSAINVLRTDLSTVLTDRGLVINGSDEFYVSLRVQNPSQVGYLTSKGVSALGNRFRLGSAPLYYNSYYVSFFASIMATSNNTTVNISDYDPGVIFQNGTPGTHVLNSGESIVISGYGIGVTDPEGFVGALVTSDQPIVVNTGNINGSPNPVAQGQDIVMDQITDENKTGHEYLISRGGGEPELEVPLIIANQDNTDVFVNGNLVTSLNEGEHYFIVNDNLFLPPLLTEPHRNMYISTNDPSKTIFVYQFIGGSNTLSGAGGNTYATSGMKFVPPLNCDLEYGLDMIPALDEIFPNNSPAYIGNLQLTSFTGSVVQVNGMTLPASDALANPGTTDWVTYLIPNIIGNAVISSDGPIAASVYGTNNAWAGFAGYYSGFESTTEESVSTDLCSDTAPIDLITHFNGALEPGGVWSPPLNSGTDIFDITTDAVTNPSLIYDYTIPSICVDKVIEVTIEKIDTPSLNQINDIDSCDSFLLSDPSTLSGVNLNNPLYYTGPQSDPTTAVLDWTIPITTDTVVWVFDRGPSVALECTVEFSFNVNITTSPVANPIATYRLCDDISNNNSEVFDLVTRNPEILLTQAATDFNIEYFTSQADADLGTVGGATAVNNMYSSAGQTMYVRIENVSNTNCFETTTFDLIVDDLPVANPVVDLVLCDDVSNDGTEDIDLTQFDTAVLNGQTSPNFVISYHPTQADADNDTAEITTAYTLNLGTTTVFVRVDNSDNMTCASTTPINIILDAQAIANPVTEYRLCDDMTNDGLEDFDLSTKDTEVLGTQTAANFTIEYFTSQVDADLGSVGGATPLTTIYNSGSTTLFVRIQTNSNTGCYDTNMFDLFVDPLPLAGTPADILVCDDPSNNGTEDVDLSQFDSIILDGQSSPINVSYHATQADADNNVSPLGSPYTVTSATPNIFARIDNSNNEICATTTTFRFVISPTPTANDVQDMVTCDDPGNDGSEIFDLTMANSEVLNGQNPADFNITYHTTLNGAQSGMGTDQIMNHTAYLSNTTTPETIFVRIEAATNPTCADDTSFTLTVSEQPTAGIGSDIVGCDDVSNDGFEEFDFSSQDAAIYNGQSTTDFNVTYHVSQADADNDVNALSFPYTNTSRSQTIYARIENTSNTDCYDVSSFLIEVFARPVIADQGPYTICAGVVENIDAGAGFSSYLWSTGATSRTIDVASGGDYTVTVTNSDGCDSTATITVVESDVAVIERIDVGQFEVNTNTLTAIVTGSGDYEFSLDNFVYQDSQRFNNLYPGFYTIYVRDKNGCGTVSMDAVIIGGPPYFTPNQDGYHDTWQVIAVETIPDATIYIFDRYGKLLKQVSPTGAGWDGNYNGTPMPSSDYWYLVELSDGHSFKGHFALKR